LSEGKKAFANKGRCGKKKKKKKKKRQSSTVFLFWLETIPGLWRI